MEAVSTGGGCDMTGNLAVSHYLQRVFRAIESVDARKVMELADLVCEVRSRNCKILVCGNGGSCTTASHMAVDLGVGSQRFGAGIRIMSLGDNVAAVTATGNDVAFDRIFAAQVQLLGSDGDVFIAISASGNSPNVLEAVRLASARGMVVVGLTGFSGGHLRDMADLSLHVATADGDYGVAEDAHLMISHMVTELVRSKLAGSPDRSDLND